MVTSPGNEFRKGWPVVLSSGIGLAVALTPLLFYSLGLFIRPLEEAFGWSRQEIYTAFLVVTLGNSVGALLAGWLADRFGSRSIALYSMACYPLCLVGLSRMEGNLQTFFILCGTAAIVGIGTTAVVFTRAVTTWFERQRGLALGITLTGTGITATLVPLYVAFFLEHIGWKGAFLSLSILPWVVGLPVIFWGFHERPAGNGVVRSVQAGNLNGFSFKQALGRTDLYIISVAAGCISFVVGSLIPHLPALLVDRGLSAAEAAKIAALVGVSVMSGRLIVGYLVDRFFAPMVAAVCLSLPAISAVLLMAGDTSSSWLVALCIGFAAGAEFDLIAYLVSRYFGLKAYSGIYSIPFAVNMIMVGIGPVIMGRIHDMQGSYYHGLQICIALGIIGALLFLVLRQYPDFDDIMRHA